MRPPDRPALRPATPPALLLMLPLLLAGCASQSSDSFLGLITPYRMEIVQGNVVTKEMAAAIKPGMTRAQVRDVLGSPLLTDIFHADRWDYVFSIRRQGAPYQQRRVTVLFDEAGLMKSFEADELPSEREFVASIDTQDTGKVPQLALTEAQLAALPVPPRRAAAASAPASAPQGPARSYPPLEPVR